MKKILIKLSSLFLLVLLASSCIKEDLNYTPKVYVQPSSLEVTITNATDTSFDVNLTATADGVAYYSVQRSDVPAPTAESLIRRTTTGSLANVKADLTAATTVTQTYGSGIYGSYTYYVYAVMTSTDGIAGSVTRTEVTTPDTLDPVFLGDVSNPPFQSGGISPFTPVTFTFSEPVFYQGGDVTFTGFFTGRQIVVNQASAMSMSDTSITVNTHGTFAPDDFIIVTWDAGTFKDNSGKSVDALSGFAHYFHTRVFTLAEQTMLMAGQYNYSTVFYGGLSGFYTAVLNAVPGSLLPSTGTFELTMNADDATMHTLNGVNIFVGLDAVGFNGEPETLPIVIDPVDDGLLAEMPNVNSAIPLSNGDTTYWSHYVGFFGPFPGFYDFGAGTITHYITLFATTSGGAVDDIDYLYTRIGTYDRNGNLMQDLTTKSTELKAKNPTKVDATLKIKVIK